MKYYKPIEFENKTKPLVQIRPVIDIYGNSISDLYITEDCVFYDKFEIESKNYLNECEKSNIAIRSDSKGRLYSRINPDTGKSRTQHVARVVRVAFDNELHDAEWYKNMEVDHINPSIPVSNNISNLEWVDHNENMYRAGEQGVMIKKYPKSLVRNVCQMICDGYSRKEIIEKLNINGQFVDDIRSGRSHASVSKEFIGKGFEYKTYDRTEKDEKAKMICELLEKGYRNIDIANMLGVRYAMVKDIRSRYTFKHISKDYNF